MVPENFSAEGGETGGQGTGFSAELGALHAAAGGGKTFTLKDLVDLGARHGFKVADSTLHTWFTGPSVPTQERHVRYVLNLLIPFLESRASQRDKGHRIAGTDTWEARLSAAKAIRKGGQGGRGLRVGAASPGRLFGMPSQALQDVLPYEFVGRDGELDELAVFAAAPDGGGPAYGWWQADAWAGKTALLAWFATRRLPAGVDAVHHFIARRLGTNHREDFLLAVGEQLASVAGRKLRASERGRPEALLSLCADAAKASAGRHRRLLLIVDGLDEDADAAPGGMSIAALLPKDPPYGMRVLVSGRAHPHVPQDVAPGHPLRDPAIVRRLAASPAAHVIRDTALQELDTLLEDRLVGSPLLGLLVVAQGALTGAGMAELAGVRPHDVGKRLRSVVGRNMAPTDTDDLLLGAVPAQDDAAHQTFVLAHEELYRAAEDALGKRELAAYEACLHAWADDYRDRGWPEDTPNYLLTGYTRLVRQNADADRLADLVLDPRRQVRLVQRSGPDVALADLALVSAPDAAATPPRLVTGARVAMSREWLLPHTRPLPRSVARTVTRLGDVRRARALAATPPHASAKALHFADVACELAVTGHKEAGDTAREAGEWARTALRAAGPFEYAGGEMGLGTEAGSVAAAGQAALALMATDQVDAGLALLRATRGSSTTRYETWAEAARLLAPDHAESAAALLDELEEEAADLAAGEPGDGTAVAVQIWETIAAVDSDRADRLHTRILEHARAVWEAEPTLENVSVLAGAASALAGDRPEEARSLTDLAHRHVEAVLLARTEPLSPTDAFHLEFGFRHTLARLAQALGDIGMPEDQVSRLLEPLDESLPGGPGDRPEHADGVDDEGADGVAVAERLAGEAFELAKLGKGRDAKSRLDQALALLPTAVQGTGRIAPRWIPALAAGLVRLDAADDVEPLLAPWQDPAGRARAYAAMSLAYADLDRISDARRYAHRAARAADMPALDGVWAHVAQALACAGEADAAEGLLRRHVVPTDRSKKAEWRRADRLARIAVGAGLADREPQRSGKLLLPLLEDLHAGMTSPQGMFTLLGRFADLLPAVAEVDGELPYGPLLHEVKDTGLDYADLKDPKTWKPETVLVHALLRIGAGEDTGRQLDWLARDLANRGPEHFPTAALAVVYAACGDVEAARRVAERLTDPRSRGAALTAVARHLARVPVHPLPAVGSAVEPAPFTRTIEHLALDVTPDARADEQAARQFLHPTLTTAGWYHALPVLAQVEPEAVARARDIAVVHARGVEKGGGRSLRTRG